MQRMSMLSLFVLQTLFPQQLVLLYVSKTMHCKLKLSFYPQFMPQHAQKYIQKETYTLSLKHMKFETFGSMSELFCSLI